jgi:hypothetical protein
VAQRLHKDDLSGRLMRERPDQCVYFAFPFIIEDEADKRRDVLKRDIGEVLVPELFGIDSVASIKKTVDPWVWQASYYICPQR